MGIDGSTLVRHLEHRIERLHTILGKDYNIIVHEVSALVADTFEPCEPQAHWSAEDHRAAVREDLWDAVVGAMRDLCLVVSEDLHIQCLIVARVLELNDNLHALWRR